MEKQFKFKELNFEIASPCDQDWEQMRGNDKSRFCLSCEKNVFNLSAMDDHEISDLLSNPEKVCVRLFKRHDGTILTEDCPIGMEKVRSLIERRQFYAACLCFLTLIFTTSLKTSAGELKGKVALPELMGDVMVMGGMRPVPHPEPTPIPTPEPTPAPANQQEKKVDEKLWKKIWE